MGLIPPLRLALAQIDTRVGDLEGNVAKIAERIAAARDAGAELVLFPELAVTGYPPEDLLLKEHFLQAATEAVSDLAREAEGIVVAGRLPGAQRRRLQRPGGARRGRAAGGLPQVGAAELRRLRRAALLPGRRGRRGARARRRAARPDHLRGHLDARPACLRRGAGRRGADPQRLRLAVPRAQGPRPRADARSSARATTCAPSPSPTWSAARTSWSSTATRCCSTTRARVLARAPQFEEALTVGTVDLQAALHRAAARHAAAAAGAPRAARGAAARAVGAARARGPVAGRRRRGAAARPRGRGLRGARARHARLRREERLRPRGHRPLRRDRLDADAARRGRRARHRPRDVRDDAVALLVRPARATTPRCSPRTSASSCIEIPIAHGDGGLRADARRRPSRAASPDITEENLQARIRGNLLMALSNKFGWLVLTTGNKSENSVGYSTLYGDIGRRLRGDQGRAEDARLPARRVPQRAGDDGAGAALDHRPPAERRAARRPEGLRLAAATTTRSTRSSRPTSRRTTTPSSSSAPGCRPTRSSA